MKWRVTLNIILDREEDARDIFEFLKKRKGLFKTVRKGEPAEEKSAITLEKHYHDEDPTKPCEVVESYESE